MTAIRSGSSISSQTPSAPKCNHPSAPGSTVTACRDFAALERTVDSCTLPNGALPVQMVTLRQTRPGPAALFGPGYSRTSTVWMSSGTERPIDSCARIARFGVYCLLRGPRAEIRPSSVFPNSAVGDSFASGARSALSLTPVVGRLGRNRGEWRGKSGQMLLPRQGSSACFCILTRRASEGNAPDPSLALRVGI